METIRQNTQIEGLNSGLPNHEIIFNFLLKEEEITWQSLLYELVKTEQMDPWDIDVSGLAKSYITIVRKMKEMDLRVSGKVVLAAAILLKIKSTRLLEEDLTQFDNLISGQDEESLYDEQAPGADRGKVKYEGLRLIPKTPQPRARKVSIYDLVEALQQALDVKRRRMFRIPVVDVKLPEKKTDISELMKNLYQKVVDFFTSEEKTKLTFDSLVSSDRKEDKIMTLIPLLHLSNNRKVDLLQEVHFGEIEIRMSNVREIERELGSIE